MVEIMHPILIELRHSALFNEINIVTNRFKNIEWSTEKDKSSYIKIDKDGLIEIKSIKKTRIIF